MRVAAAAAAAVSMRALRAGGKAASAAQLMEVAGAPALAAESFGAALESLLAAVQRDGAPAELRQAPTGELKADYQEELKC
jgi:hypothetical protein